MNVKAFLFLLFIINICKAQTGGEHIFLFLKNAHFAHQNSLGGKTLTLSNSVHQPYHNPALISSEITKKIGISYTNFLTGASSGMASYVHHFKKKHPVFLNLTYVNYGKLIEADEKGNETGSFNANDLSATIGYAHSINENIKIGANVKLIYSNISQYSSTGIGTDLGISFADQTQTYLLTLVLKNLGFQISKFNNFKEHLPFEIALGASLKMDKVPLQWHFTLENLQKWNVAAPNPSETKTDLNDNKTIQKITFIDNLIRHFSIGAELFPEKIVNLRIGYNFRKGQELKLQNTRTLGGLTFGLGLRLNKFKVNYAFAKHHSATDIHNFGLILSL